MLTNSGIFPGSLCLNYSQWFAVISPQHIVHISNALNCGHSLDFIFTIFGLIKCPPSFMQEEVDEIVPSLFLIVVVSVLDTGICCLYRSDFCLKLFDLL